MPSRRSSAPATTAPTRSTPCARLAEAGWNAVAVHHDTRPRGRPGRRGGRRRRADDRPDGAGRGRRRARRHPRHRRPTRAAAVGAGVGRRAARDRPRHRGRPALGPGPDGRRARPRRRARRRDRDLLGRQARAPPARRPSRRAASSPSSTSASTSTAEPVVRRLDHDDVAALWPGAVVHRRQVLPRRRRCRRRRRVLHRRGAAQRHRGRVAPGPGMVRYVGTPTPTGLVRARSPRPCTAPAASRPGSSGPGLDAGSRADGAQAQLEVAREALAGAEPVVVDAGGLDLLDAAVLRARADAVTLLTPHAGECARLLTRLDGARDEVDARSRSRPRRSPTRGRSPRSPAPPCSSRARRRSSCRPARAPRRGRRPTPRRGSPRRVRATCSPACSARCSPPASPPTRPGPSAPSSTGSRRTGPTPGVRCARSRWRTASRERWPTCWVGRPRRRPRLVWPMTHLATRHRPRDRGRLGVGEHRPRRDPRQRRRAAAPGRVRAGHGGRQGRRLRPRAGPRRPGRARRRRDLARRGPARRGPRAASRGRRPRPCSRGSSSPGPTSAGRSTPTSR